MVDHRHLRFAASLLAGSTLALAMPSTAAAKPTVIRGSPTPTVTVYATGLNNPRGLKWGPDGMLYVAEGGVGGSDSTADQCRQVIPPIGPYTGNSNGGSRISRIENGVRVTVNDKFPSSQTAPTSGSLVSGVADIGWIDGTLYALVSGGGCSHGVLGTPNGIYRVEGSKNPVRVANLSAFYRTHPVANPEHDDFEPDGTPYSMVTSGGAFYVVEPNHGELDRVTTSGTITRIADISASQGHIVPTAIAQRGTFYIGNLNTFPIVPGSSKILRVSVGGDVHTVVTGLTTVLGVAFDSRSRMYVLENTVTAGEPAAGQGEILRFTGKTRETLVTGLSLPTAMTFGPDGALYVSNVGFGPPPIGLGQILRIRIDD